jgi:hypothetical protein
MSPTSRELVGALEIAKVIRDYEKRFGSLVLQNLQRRIELTGRDTITQEDIDNAVTEAYRQSLKTPEPDADMVRRSNEDIQSGRTRPIQDLIDGL